MDGEKASDVNKDQLHHVQEVTFVELTLMIKEEEFSSSEDDINNVKREKEREMDGEKASHIEKDQIHGVQEVTCMEITPIIKEEAFSGFEGDIDIFSREKEIYQHLPCDQQRCKDEPQEIPGRCITNKIGESRDKVQRQKEREMDGEKASDVNKDQIHCVQEVTCMELTPIIKEEELSSSEDDINHHERNKSPEFCRKQVSAPALSVNYLGYMEGENPVVLYIKEEELSSKEAEIGKDDGDQVSLQSEHVNQSSCSDSKDCVNISLCSETVQTDTRLSSATPASTDYAVFMKSTENFMKSTENSNISCCTNEDIQPRSGEEMVPSAEVTKQENSDPVKDIGNWWSKSQPHKQLIYDDEPMLKISESCDCKMHEPTGSICSFCHKKFERTEAGGTKQHQCLVCGCSFVKERQCSKHLGSRKQTYKDELQEIPGRCITDKIGESRGDSHEKSNESCDCTESARSNKSHQKTDIGGEKHLQCMFCICSFPAECQLTEHLRSHSSREPMQNFQCLYCKKLFVSNHKLMKHMKICTGKRPMKTYECSCCGSMFKKKRDFEMHIMKRCTGKRPKKMLKKTYECACCNSMFKKKIDFKMHIRKGCTGKKLKKTYQCSCCNSMFEKKSDFKVHIRREHVKEKCKLICQGSVCTLEKKFQCCCCGKEFQKKSDLTRHVRGEKRRKKIDRGEMQHECSYCGMKFSCIRHLNEHFQSHAETQARKREENFPCCFCSMQFGKVSILAQHIKSHSAEQSKLDLAMIRCTRKNLPEHSHCEEKFAMKKKRKHIVKEYSIFF